MGLWQSIGSTVTSALGWGHNTTPVPEIEPPRAPVGIEKLKQGVPIPNFLPYYDPLQNLHETAEMRLAYRQMLADPNIKAALFGKLFAVMSRELKVHPAVPTGEGHKKIADYCEWNLKRRLAGGIPRLGWNILVGACIDGYSVNEKVWGVQDKGRWEGKRVLRRLKAKDPDQDLVLWTDEFKNVTAVQGLRYNAGEYWNPKDFLIYTHLPLFENATGMSDFRAVYSRWWTLDTVLKLRAMGAERRALPVVVGHYSAATNQTQLENVLAAIKYRNWLAVPDSVKVEVLDLAGTSAAYFSEFRRDCQEEIFLGVQLATLQALVGGQGQMRGDSEVHQDTADTAKWVLAEAMVNCLNDMEGGLLKEMVDFNFMDPSDYPYATLKSTDDDSLSKSITVDTGLQQMGYKLSNLDIQERYGRPMATDESDELKAPEQPGAKGAGGAPPAMGGDGASADDDLAALFGGGTGEDEGGGPPAAAPRAPQPPKPPGKRFAESDWSQQRGERGGHLYVNRKTGAKSYSKPGAGGDTSHAGPVAEQHAANATGPLADVGREILEDPEATSTAKGVFQSVKSALANIALSEFPRWALDTTSDWLMEETMNQQGGPGSVLAVKAANFAAAKAFLAVKKLFGGATAHGDVDDLAQRVHALMQTIAEATGGTLQVPSLEEICERLVDAEAGGGGGDRSSGDPAGDHHEFAESPLTRLFDEDATGHQHRGKGKGGGQFVSQGGGGSQGVAEDKPRRRFTVNVQRGPTLKEFLRGEQVTGFTSSNVQAFEYDKPAGELYVQFSDDRWYRYSSVSHGEAQGLFRANSKGGWVWDKLRIRGTVYGHRKPYALVASPASDSGHTLFAEGRPVKFAGEKWSPYTGARGGKGWRSSSGKIIYGANPPGGARGTAGRSNTAPPIPKLRDMQAKARSLMHGKVGARQTKAIAAELANMTHADLQKLKTRLGMTGGNGKAATAAKIAEQLRAPGHAAAMAHVKHVMAKLPEGEREAALHGLLGKMEPGARAKVAQAHGASTSVPKRLAKHIAGGANAAKKPAAKAPATEAKAPTKPARHAQAPPGVNGSAKPKPAEHVAKAAQALRDLSDSSVKASGASYAQIENTVRALAKGHSLADLKQIASAFGVRSGLTSKPAIAQRLIAAISERKGRHERGEEIGKVAAEHIAKHSEATNTAIAKLQTAIEKLETREPTTFNINVAPAPAPHVTVPITLPPGVEHFSEPIEHKVIVNVPPQPPPEVTINAPITVQPADVNVTLEQEPIEAKLTRDRTGDITAIEIKPKPE